MKNLKIVLLTTLLLTLLGCDNNKIENEEYKIISFFVNKVVPFPLPVPPIDSEEARLSKFVYDSIMKKDIRIGIYNKFKLYPKKIQSIGNDSIFLELVKDFNELKEIRLIDLSRIDNNDNRKIIGYDQIQTKNKEYLDFDASLSFSPMVFNKDLNKSIVIIGEGRSELWGTTILYYLIKKENKWFIYDKKTLEIS